MEIRPLTLKDWLEAQPKIRAMEWCLDEKCPNNIWYDVKFGATLKIKLPEKGGGNDQGAV